MFKSFKEKLGKFFKSKKETEEHVEKPKIEKEKIKKIKEEIKEVEKEKAKKKKPEVKKEIKEEKVEEKPKEELAEENEEEIEQAIEKYEEKQEERKLGFFEKIAGKIGTVKLDQKTFDEFFEELEAILLENNVALIVVDKIRKHLEENLVHIEIKKSEIEDEIKKTLRKSISDVLIEPFDIIKKINENKEDPFIILFFGINGSGKTTTISKLAYLLQENKIPCVFAAADTFRAASIEQLQKHGDKLKIKVISHDYGSDPAAVAFDAVKYAKSKGMKVVLIDTAGRMHTKDNLLKEMKKIIRVIKPDLKIFIAESITGNDAVEQAKTFNESFGIDGTILTKSDVDERGGTAISIGNITNKPILFLGTGQEYKDLQKFSKKEILSNLGLD